MTAPSPYWQALEDGGVIHRIPLAELRVGQHILLVTAQGREFIATVTAIDGDNITLQEHPDALGYMTLGDGPTTEGNTQ